ncbi:MAG: 6-carboxytetrahydropterin synthase QueD [Spirochaetes bacterium]|nr:6-carboxytetrahydropterin synthase QueD [Spirochaetota bacterium]
MYTVRVQAGFAAAHFLAHYHGKCERLHGHNYRVRVTASGASLDDGGMLVDFGVLKEALKSILAELDHTNLNDHPAFADGNSSAERIAAFVGERMTVAVPEAAISLVEVFETDTSRATWSPD